MPQPETQPNDREPASLRLGDFLPYRLSVLSNTISTAIAEAYGDRFGLTIWQWRCMAVIGETPGLAARDVTLRTAMDKVAVSRAVAGLVSAGHVTREANETDRRASRLFLTPQGQRTYAEIIPLARAYEGRLLAGFSDEELAQLRHFLKKLAEMAKPGHPPLW